jgi:ProP effector
MLAPTHHRNGVSSADVAAVLILLAERWPRCFFIYERRRRPLKIGIHLDILATLDSAVTEIELGTALACYVANRCYRLAMTAGAPRIDLDGNPAGEVTAEQAETARKQLLAAAEKRQRREAARKASAPKPAPTPAPALPARKGSSLAELREAGLRRRAAGAGL